MTMTMTKHPLSLFLATPSPTIPTYLAVMAVCSKEAEKCFFDLSLSNVTFSRAAKYVLVGSDAQQRIKVATQTLLQSRVKLFCLVLSYHKVYLDIWITS